MDAEAAAGLPGNQAVSHQDGALDGGRDPDLPGLRVVESVLHLCLRPAWHRSYSPMSRFDLKDTQRKSFFDLAAELYNSDTPLRSRSVSMETFGDPCLVFLSRPLTVELLMTETSMKEKFQALRQAFRVIERSLMHCKTYYERTTGSVC